MRITTFYVRAQEAFIAWWCDVADERRSHADRGDVPGWVLVTVMTAGLVTVLWAVAGDKLQGMLETALDSVTGG